MKAQHIVTFAVGDWDREVFKKMALRITEQWIRERVKLKHDNLGKIS